MRDKIELKQNCYIAVFSGIIEKMQKTENGLNVKINNGFDDENYKGIFIYIDDKILEKMEQDFSNEKISGYGNYSYFFNKNTGKILSSIIVKEFKTEIKMPYD